MRQTTSGLPNNVIYGLDIVDDNLWVATAAGLGALNLKTGEWSIYDRAIPPPLGVFGKGARRITSSWVFGAAAFSNANCRTAPSRNIAIPTADFHFEPPCRMTAGQRHHFVDCVGRRHPLAGTYFGISRYEGSRWRTSGEEIAARFQLHHFIWPHGRVAWVGRMRRVG